MNTENKIDQIIKKGNEFIFLKIKRINFLIKINIKYLIKKLLNI